MKSSFKNELKIVLIIAKWEYCLKFCTSIVIRGILLVIPILFSAAINYVTVGNSDMTIIMQVISIFLVGIYRFFEGYNQVSYYKLHKKIFTFYNAQALKATKDNPV